MTSYTARTLFAAGFAALLAGCGSSQGANEPAPAPQEQSGDVTSQDIARSTGQSI